MKPIVKNDIKFLFFTKPWFNFISTNISYGGLACSQVNFFKKKNKHLLKGFPILSKQSKSKVLCDLLLQTESILIRLNKFDYNFVQVLPIPGAHAHLASFLGDHEYNFTHR